MNTVPFTRKLLLIPALVLVAITSACAANGAATVTPTETVASVPTQTPTPTQPPEPVPSELVACSPYLCSIPSFWEVGPNGPEILSLPGTLGLSYDATAATGRLLYSTKFPDHGVGPGNIAVGDLWWLDVRSGQTRAIIPDEIVVEAAWAPDGQNFAYVLATPETYELRWYTASGEDKLLARDAAFTFSVSPASDQVAFTRETRYNLDVTPGLYVVDVATGQERQISSVDRAGTGGMTDQPIWSPDGKHILLPIVGDMHSWQITATDGSQSTQLKILPEVSEALQDYSLGFALWHPDGVHLVGSSFPGMGGGSSNVLLFGLNPALDTVISAKALKEDNSILVGWREPGVSLWVRSPEGVLESVPVE